MSQAARQECGALFVFPRGGSQVVTFTMLYLRRSAILMLGEERAVSGTLPCLWTDMPGGWVRKVADADVGRRLFELPL